MAREYIITMTAANRIGILAGVTNAMAELGGDLCECSQTIVRGCFTMIFAAEFPEDRDPQVILDHLHGVCAPWDIDVRLRNPGDEQPADSGGAGAKFVLHFMTVDGTNQKGILRKIASELSMLGVDIYGMRAFRREGDRQFRMNAKLVIPPAMEPQSVADRLNELGASSGFSARMEGENRCTVAGTNGRTTTGVTRSRAFVARRFRLTNSLKKTLPQYRPRLTT